MRFKTIVGDSQEDLAAVLRAGWRGPADPSYRRPGPTEDDLTREVVAEVLGRPLREIPEIRQRIQQRFARLGRQMPQNNLRQAQVPEGADWLENGTARRPESGWNTTATS